MKNRFTYDEIISNGITKILIRLANDKDEEVDIFEDLPSCRKAVNNHLNMDIFISSEILNSMF